MYVFYITNCVIKNVLIHLKAYYFFYQFNIIVCEKVHPLKWYSGIIDVNNCLFENHNFYNISI